MSTVVLTPTHIASDHNVVHKTFPHETVTNLDHPKIYISPSRKFLFGTTGEFLPTDLDCPEVYLHISDIMGNLIGQQINHGLIANMAIPSISVNMKKYEEVFDRTGKTFLVSRNYRFLIYYSQKHKEWIGRQVAAYSGIGSGGALATGLLTGGMDIRDIWTPLHEFDNLSSVEHTIIPLSILKKVKLFPNSKDEKLRHLTS